MNKKILSAIMGAAIVGFGAYVANTMAATQTGNAAATIVTAITITEDATMNFGSISVGAGGGTVVLDTSDGVSTTGDAVAEGGTVTSAVFSIDGDNNAGYAVTMPANITVDDGGGNNMTINTFTYLAEDAATDTTGTMDVTGAGTMTIGGTLTVSASQVAGSYSGTYTITALYQ